MRATGRLRRSFIADGDTLLFDLGLQSTAVLSKGSGDPTFTRATTGTVQDFEGLIKPVLSGELRIGGARRVANLTPFPEDLENAGWSNSNMTVASGVSDPDGGSTAFTLTSAASNATLLDTFINTPLSTGDS